MVWYLLGCSHCHKVITCTIRVLKAGLKRCPLMSRPLHLCVSGKLYVSHNNRRPHFPAEGSVKPSNMALIMLSRYGHPVGSRVTGRGGQLVHVHNAATQLVRVHLQRNPSTKIVAASANFRVCFRFHPRSLERNVQNPELNYN